MRPTRPHPLLFLSITQDSEGYAEKLHPVCSLICELWQSECQRYDGQFVPLIDGHFSFDLNLADPYFFKLSLLM